MVDPVTWVVVATVVTRLHEAIARAIGKDSEFKFKLQLLQTTVNQLLRKLNEIENLNVQNPPGPEAEKLKQILMKGVDLASTCSDISWWNCRKKRKYEKRIDELDQSLQRFISLDLQIVQFANILQVLNEVIRMNSKLEHLVIPRRFGHTDGEDGNINGKHAADPCSYEMGIPADTSRIESSFNTGKEINCFNCFCCICCHNKL